MAGAQVLDKVGTAVSETSVQEFHTGLRGALVRPGDDGYEAARKVWNGNIDRSPGLIARCAGPADVIQAVNFARSHNLLVAVRGGAHNAAGHGTCDGGLVIDLSLMKGIRVDPARRTAQVQGGALWADVDHETLAFGLATTGGTVSNTGVAGLTLGGGEGWLMGEHGLTCDNLLSADIVTADGRFLHASAKENEDLFWGLRGGGGNFGAVTSFEFQLHPVEPLVLGGMVLHPLERARDVLRFYREFSSALPDAAEAHIALLTAPDGAAAAALLLGYNGPVGEGERVLAPARSFGTPMADMVQPMPYAVRQSLLDEGFAAHGVQRYWKSAYAKTLSDEFIDVLVKAAASFPSPMAAVPIFNWHGLATRVASDATAFALRQPQWDINVVSQWVEASETETNISWVRQVWDRLEPLTEGNAYINHIAGDDRPEKVRASYGSNYDRLLALKRKYDPANLFRLNANINPAG